MSSRSFARPDKANKNVMFWSSAVPLADTFLSAITILEIEVGALSIERKDAAQGRILRAWIDDQIMPLGGSNISAGRRRRRADLREAACAGPALRT